MLKAHAPQPREVELKLEVDPDLVGQLLSHPFFRSGTRTKQLRATYFDTRKHALRAAGLALRIRDNGDGRLIQTVKAERPGSGPALDRDEWESVVSSHEPDVSALDGTPVERLLRGAAGKLRPLFTAAVERSVADHRDNGTALELALDRGRIEVGDRSSTVAELEIELKEGEPRALFRAALSLAATAPLRLSLRTKSERGYALAGADMPRAVKAEPIELRRGQSTASAFQQIAGSCLKQLVQNEALLRENPNPDAVHQARVGIRRLRAAISLFKHVVADAETEKIKAELKGMAEPLGEARDLDVFIAKVLKPAAKANGSDRRRARAEYGERRDAAYERALQMVSSDQFARSVLDVAAWIAAGAWLDGDEPEASDEPVEVFAAQELARRWRKLRSRLKGIEDLDEEARHRVRIEVKKLRYAIEFFSSLFAAQARKKRVKTCLDAVEGLQGTLGDLNDLAVARGMAGPQPPSAVRDREAAAPALLAKLAEQARQFRAVEPFWVAG